MKAAICDDSQPEREQLSSYIARYAGNGGYDISTDIYSGASGLLAAVQGSPSLYGMAFLDIYMDSMDGVELARKMRAAGFKGDIVFTTTSTEHALDGYRVEAIGYLVKPYSYEELAHTMDRIVAKKIDSLKSITVKSDRIEHTIPYRDILYVETEGRYSAIRTAKGRVLCRVPLADLETTLCAEPNFLRCHRSCIVNINHIASSHPEYISMDNGEHVPINIKKSLRIRQQIADYLFDSM